MPSTEPSSGLRELIRTIGRDIVILWIACLAIFTVYLEVKDAFKERVAIQASFNTMSIIRAFNRLKEEDVATEAHFREWYFGSTMKLELFDEYFDRDISDLAPQHGYFFIISVADFPTGNICNLLMHPRTGIESRMHDKIEWIVEPNSDCLGDPVYRVFPSTLVYAPENNTDRLTVKEVYFNKIWFTELDNFVPSFPDLFGKPFNYCDLTEYCRNDSFELTPADSNLAYYSDERMHDEFKIDIVSLLTPVFKARVGKEVIDTHNNAEPLSQQEFADAWDREQAKLTFFNSRSSSKFLEQDVRTLAIPFIAILVVLYLVNSITVRAYQVKFSEPAYVASKGLLLGPVAIWNIPHMTLKVAMIFSPLFATVLVGLIFQDIFRLPLNSNVFVNPLDGMTLETTPRVEAGRSILFHNLPLVFFNVTLLLWALALFSSLAATILLARAAFDLPKIRCSFSGGLLKLRSLFSGMISEVLKMFSGSKKRKR